MKALKVKTGKSQKIFNILFYPKMKLTARSWENIECITVNKYYLLTCF